MRDSTLYPLNQLRDIHPDLFDAYSKKYEDRRWVTEQRIPALDDCLWNDVIFTAAVHPQVLYDLRKAAGFPELPPQEYYQIDPTKLDKSKLAVFLFRPETTREAPLTSNDFAAYHYSDLSTYAAVRQETVDYFHELRAQGATKIPLFWRYVPHIMYRGQVDVSDTTVLSCS